jgi:hypothetical protein
MLQPAAADGSGAAAPQDPVERVCEELLGTVVADAALQAAAETYTERVQAVEDGAEDAMRTEQQQGEEGEGEDEAGDEPPKELSASEKKTLAKKQAAEAKAAAKTAKEAAKAKAKADKEAAKKKLASEKEAAKAKKLADKQEAARLKKEGAKKKSPKKQVQEQEDPPPALPQSTADGTGTAEYDQSDSSEESDGAAGSSMDEKKHVL